MELAPVPKREFMAKFERHEPLIQDHTSVICAKYCTRKYFYQIVLGFVPRTTAPYFAFGGAYHKFREHLEREYVDNIAKNMKPDDAALLAFPIALKIAVDSWKKVQGNDPPAGSKWEFMTKERLALSCKVAWQHWVQEKKNNKITVVSIEQPFNVQLADGSATSGRFDQIIRWNGKLWGRDFKTTSKEGAYYTRGLDPNDQFTRYTFSESKLCGEQVQGQIVEVLYNSKRAGPTITAYPTTRTDYQLEQWEREQIHFNKMIDLCRNEDIWPMQEHSCGFCDYHSVCKMPSEASMMAKLQNEFVVREWDNTKVGVTE